MAPEFTPGNGNTKILESRSKTHLVFLQPANEVMGQGNVFHLPVCLSTAGGGWCDVTCYYGQHLPPLDSTFPPLDSTFPPRQHLPQTASPPDSTSPWRAPPLSLLRWKSGYYASYWNAILLYFYQNLCRISADRAVRVMFGTEVPKEQYVPVHRIV